MSIILYEHHNFNGKTLLLTESETDLRTHSFNDTLSSFKVTSGTWRLYTNTGYVGRYIELVPGSYNMDILTASLGNDRVSSAKLM